MTRLPLSRLLPLTLLSALSLVGAAAAGEIFGTVSQGGVPIVGARVAVRCEPALVLRTPQVPSDGFGAYRLFIDGEGACQLFVNNIGPLEARSYHSPQRYNLEVVADPSGRPALRRR